MNYLICHLKSCAPLIIADSTPDLAFDLTGLSDLLGYHTENSLPDKITADSIIGTMAQINILPNTDNFLSGKTFIRRLAPTSHDFFYLRSAPDTVSDKVEAWRSLLIHACITKILKGENMMLMHGVLLALPSGDGLLLCGQSGMGKTTTSRRWIEAGGQCHADDMVLLEYGEKTLYAHPMPTWSRCMENLDGENRPMNKAIPIRAILALSRDDTNEELRSIDKTLFLLSIYSSCLLFPTHVIKYMPAPEQKYFIDKVQNVATTLANRFPNLGLCANLQGDIRSTLKEYL